MRLVFEKTGVVGLYLFSLGMWIHKGISNAGIFLMLLGLLFSGWNFPKAAVGRHRIAGLLRSPVFVVTILWVLYLLLRMAQALHGDNAVLHLKEGFRLIWLAGFLLVAWYLEGKEERILKVLGLACLSFFLGRLLYLDDLWQWKWDFWRYRYAMGLPTAIPFGQYAAAVTLGLMVMGKRFWRRKIGCCKSWLIGGWYMALAVALECLILSHSRGVWAAFVLVMVVVLVMGWRLFVNPRRILPFTIGSTVVLLIALGIVQSEAVVERLQEEQEVYSVLLKGNVEKVPAQHDDGREYSVGVRVAMWRFGLRHWLEKPWIGWGPGATKALIECCAPDIFKRFNDLHSAYVEILVRLGLVGFLLMVAVAISVLISACQGLRESRLAADIFVFVVGALLLHALIAAVNFRMLNYDWRFYWYLFGGIAATFDLWRSDETEEDS